MNRFLLLLLLLTVAGPGWAIERGVSGQFLELTVFDSSTGAPKTGDAANLTAYVSIDGDATPDALADTTATEVDATNLKGVYRWDLSAAETNGRNVVYGGRSTTNNVALEARFVATDAPNFSLGVSGAGTVLVATVSNVTTQTEFDVTAGFNLAGGPDFEGWVVIARDVSSSFRPLPGSARRIVSTDQAGGSTLTLIISSAFDFTLAAGDIIEIYPPDLETLTRLPNATPGQSGGVFIAGSNAATTANITGNITGNLSGSVGSVTNRVTANTDQWAGAATATDDIALKSSLAKGTDISGFNDPTAAANATAVRTELATELARLDASVSSRHASGAAVASVTGNLGGSVIGTVGGFTAGALADLFDTNSGKSYSDAVAGSVVKEVADHATTPSLTAAGIADAVLDELLAGHTAAGSLSKAVSDIYDFLNGAPTFGDAMDGQGYTMDRAKKIDKLAPSLLLSSTISGTPSSQTSFVLAAGPPDDDALNGALVIVTAEGDESQKAVGLVKDYDQATKTVTLVTDPGIFTFAEGDEVDVIASGTSIPLWLSGP